MASNVYMGPSADKVDITEGELRSIEKAMENKEFRDLLADYIQEISDPKHKDEYETYLRQLEDQKELPKDMKLIQPEAGFCLKTTMKNKNRPDFSQKFFINVCTANEVQKPSSSENTDKSKGRGQNWQIPYSVGKIRPDQDNKKEICNTVDVVFHPYALELTSRNEQFTKLICETALDGATKQLPDESDKISRDYKLLKKLKCKGDKPALLAIRDPNAAPGASAGTSAAAGKENVQAAKPSPASNDKRQEDHVPKLYQQYQQQQKDYLNTKAKEEAEKKKAQSSNGRIQELASYEFDEDEEERKRKEMQKTAPGKIAAPKYKLTYSYDIDLGQFTNEREKSTKPPRTLILQIELPQVQKLSELELDIDDQEFVLQAKGKYYLDLKLPYKVLKDEGSAKFDTKTTTLKVTLPIDKASLPLEQKMENNFLINEENVADGEAEQNNGHQSQEASAAQVNGDSVLELGEEKGGLRFVDHAQIERSKNEQRERLEKGLGNESNGKSLIQEIEQPSQTETKKQQPAPQQDSHTPVLPEKIEYKVQETSENYFFIFNLPKYDKTNVTAAFYDNQALLKYTDAKRNPVFWAEFTKEIIPEESQCNCVTDYVVLNLKKKTAGFWEKADYTEKDHNEEFEKLLNDYINAQASTSSDKTVEQPKQQEPQEVPTETTETSNTDKSDVPTEEQQEQEQEDTVEQEKIQIQLIQFDKDFFAFKLD